MYAFIFISPSLPNVSRTKLIVPILLQTLSLAPLFHAAHYNKRGENEI